MLGLSSYSRHLTSVSPSNPCEVAIINPRFIRQGGKQLREDKCQGWDSLRMQALPHFGLLPAQFSAEGKGGVENWAPGAGTAFEC